ncbi:HAMP domain-containing sensor histidine kinase [soil metagenome]
MLQNVYQRFADWAIALRSKAQTDPFFVTRLQLMVLYFVIGAVLFMFFGWFLSSISFSPVLQIGDVGIPGTPAQAAFSQYHQELFLRRFLLSVVFAVSTYFLTQFAMRPIRKSVELQQRFFATVSHELRTPLTIVKNSIEVALRNPQSLDQEKSVRILTSALEDTNRMSDTIAFLLSLSSLSIQKNIPDMQSLMLSDVAERALTSIRHEATHVGVSITSAALTPGIVRGNPVALAGLITNLVRNALNHTPKGGAVAVTIDAYRTGTRLTVSDTGSGIRKKDLPYIFEPFYRGANDRDVRLSPDGLGLGLSLVKEVSRLHGARVSVKSTEGHGTVFSVVFPRA